MNNVINHESIKQIVLYDTQFEIRCLNLIDEKKQTPKSFYCKNVNEYTKILPKLINLNEKQHYNIYIAPKRYDFMLFDDLTAENIIKMLNDYEIYYIVETSKNNFQAILKFKNEFNKEYYEKISKYLKNQYGADKACASDYTHIHRIAGFFNKKAKYLLPFLGGDFSNNMDNVIIDEKKLFCSKFYNTFDKFELNKIINAEKSVKLMFDVINLDFDDNTKRKSIKIKNVDIKDVDFIKKFYKNNIACDEYIQNIYNTQKYNKKYKSLSEVDLVVCYLSKKKKFTFKETAAAIIKTRPEQLEKKHFKVLDYLIRTYNEAT
jgi:hypothetical protein